MDTIASDQIIEDIKADVDFMKIYEKCRPFTLTSVERAYSLYKSCQYVIAQGLEGDFVECGVWKGGSVMIIAYTLVSLGVSDRKIYLYDTFEGMSEPENIDVDLNNESAKTLMAADAEKSGHVWAYAGEQEVRENIFSTGYEKKNFVFVKGKVEETIPGIAPQKIALLRLDTDWYSSTYHELTQLYPLLIKSGILIIDDYGHWAGARKAVDEYFNEFDRLIFLQRVDYTGRVLIKQSENEKKIF